MSKRMTSRDLRALAREHGQSVRWQGGGYICQSELADRTVEEPLHPGVTSERDALTAVLTRLGIL